MFIFYTHLSLSTFSLTSFFQILFTEILFTFQEISIQPNDDNEVTTMGYQTISPLPTMPVNFIQNIESIENRSKDETSSIPSFVCDTCSMTLSSKESLADHVKSHFSNTKPKKSKPNKSSQRKHIKQDKEPTKSTSSQNSNTISETKMQRIKETLTSEGQFLCDICGKALQTESGMRLHLKMHTGLKPYKCKFCEKSFVIESYKKRHELTHSGDKSFMCHLCSASFASANGFRYHLMAHAGDARHSCSTCGKSFVRHKYLVEHQFTHTGQKPFACQLCGVAYANSGSLFVHKKKCKGVINKRRENKRSEIKIVSNVYTKKIVEGQIVVVNSNLSN